MDNVPRARKAIIEHARQTQLLPLSELAAELERLPCHVPPLDGTVVGPWPLPQGLPLFKPPYSRMTAIDMNTGEHVWTKPMGSGDRIRNLPMLRDLDLPPLGGDSTRAGPVLTKTLLIYALTTGGSSDGPRLVAFDKGTGDEIASVDLPGGAIGTPMTYMEEGKQYIALTVGGSRVPELVALALPE